METPTISYKVISLADVANVKDAFEIKTIQNCEIMALWEKAEDRTSEAYQEILSHARQDLAVNWNIWNEEELKMNFVSPIMRASQIDIPNKIRTFYERPLNGIIGQYKFSVVCDCMVATPSAGGRPVHPYFFFQEFKKGKGDKLDPEAQVLVAMLLAQQINNDQKPIYGAWLQGEYWYFVVLNNKEYCVGHGFRVSESSQLSKVVGMLQKLKEMIDNR